PPADPTRIDARIKAIINVIVGYRGEQIVGCCDRVEIAGEVEVDVLHLHDPGIAAAGRTSLDAKARTEASLAQTQDDPLDAVIELFAEPDCRRRLACAGWRRGDSGD